MIKIFREILANILIRLNNFNDQDSNILSIFFHNPGKKIFTRIIRWLVKNGYKFITIKDLEYHVNNRTKAKKLVLITFDDGWKENLNLFDCIEKYKIPIGIFIPTNSIKEGNYWWEYARIKGQNRISNIETVEEFKKLSEEDFSKRILALKENFKLERSCITLKQLKELSCNKLVTIGSHTKSHPILKKCSPEHQIIEFSQSKIQLEAWIGKEIEYFSYPNGDYNNESIDIAKSSGYKFCFTTQPNKIDVENFNPFLIPRISMNDRGGYYENISKILGIWYKFKIK